MAKKSVIAHRVLAALVALITLGSGVVNLSSLIGPSLPERLKILREVFPIEFIHYFRFFTLMSGFALVISAINIYRQKKRAFQFVLILAILAIIFNLIKGLDYEEALFNLFLVITLLLTRRNFTVKSSTPDLLWGVSRLTIGFMIAIIYGVAGFWFLDQRHFGIDFHLMASIQEALRYMALIGDPGLIPLTHYARWFLDSLYVMTTIAIVTAIYSLYRPVIYRFRTLPHERRAAREITEKYGRSAMDYFKFWPDKSFLFSPSGEAYIAYGVARGFAMALADPVGPEHEIEGVINQFIKLCRENDWKVCFHQTLPDFIPIYRRLGFKKLKLGDDAIVDLATFALEAQKKEMRHSVRKTEASGVQTRLYEPPISDDVLAQIKEVSDEWLQIPGRRERKFTLGLYDPHYLRGTPLFTAEDNAGHILAFTNLIPAWPQGYATIDLMRRCTQAPGGIMDFLFVKLFLHLKKQGYLRFNFGMAPMSGFRDDEEASVEEKSIHYFFQHLDFLFSYLGLQSYKAKFANFWEPRYAIYQSILELPQMALALRDLTEFKRWKQVMLSQFAPLDEE